MTTPQGREPLPHASSPTALKQRLARLSPEKLAALQQRLQQQERSGYEPLCALPAEAVYPLSFHQQRLWFIEQFHPGTPLYNVTRAIRMRGLLNRGALKSALESLVHRHEALRTTFHMVDDEPVQQINTFPGLQLPFVDLRTASGDREITASVLRQQLSDEGRRPFDLSLDLMLRAVLYQLADDEHVLQITIHHLSCDGWSFQLLFNELSVLYRGICSAQSVKLPPIALRYVDFVRWQKKPRQSELFAERVRWWKRQLADAPQVLELATDRPRPQIESGSGAFQPLEFPSDLLAQLETFSRKESVTLYMTLLAGFFILLHRHTGMEDFLVGSADAGRHRPETHQTVGFFVDTVVLRADLSGDPTARQVLQRVRQTVIDGVNYGDVPFNHILQSLALPRDLSRPPLIQILFNALPQYSLELGDLAVSPVKVDLQTSRFDLEMTYADGANRSTGMTWNTDLFNVDTIQRMLGHYCTLLKAIIADPNQPVRQLPLLTEQERHQLLVEWNGIQKDYPREQCIHELFATQVKKTPDAVAVVYEDQQLTYRELNARANQLAHYLRKLGVGPDVLVAVCVERSVDLLVGLLGILKAGGAYLPLDPTYPQERLAFLLHDAQVPVLVTQEPLSPALPPHAARLVCLDSDWREISTHDSENLVGSASASDLAYVIYTSGSTGKPKGVPIPHRALVNFVVRMGERPGMTADDALLAVTMLPFDIAALEMFLPLTTGARVIVASHSIATDGALLTRLLTESRATMMQATPATWRMLLDAGWLGNRRLKALCGGEVLSRELAAALLTKCDQLWNLYGPTEATIWSMQHQVTSVDKAIPIGRPIANTQIYILDSRLNLAPIGIAGELHIGGTGLGHGYLNLPELTAEQFIPNPFSREPGARLYRTGDLARYLSDGNIEFLGRSDHQVKLRGYRIELGEIEAVVAQHPLVQAAVVLAREDTPGDKRLVAYLVSRGASVSMSEVRKFLACKLPEYMIPSAVVFLEQFPLTPNGKIDRKALPAPDQTRPELAEQYRAARTPTEVLLAGIWAEVLKIERVGMHDNFFALGGHSLLAMMVIARINKRFHVAVPLRSLFQLPTVAALAQLIDEQQGRQLSADALDSLLSAIEVLSEQEVETLLTMKRKKNKEKSDVSVRS